MQKLDLLNFIVLDFFFHFRDAGYISDGSAGYNPAPGGGNPNQQPGAYRFNPVPVKTTPDATYMSRDEVETEIF